MATGDPISGRPDQEEQQQLAATVGAALRQLRLAQRLSIRDLERRSGVSRQMVSLLEHGQRSPRSSVLGWLAWGLAGPDRAEEVKQALCDAAGDSLVMESRWSERTHARRAWRQLQIGGMELPGWLVAPYCVAILGGVMPDRMDDLRKAQEAARAGKLPWPESMACSNEALMLADELDRATLHELRNIGRGMAREDQAAKERAARKRHRELRAPRRGGHRHPAPRPRAAGHTAGGARDLPPAGRPRSRGLDREVRPVTRRLRPPPPPLEMPEPGKPLGEMTAAERETYFRKLRRALRDDQVRRGNRAPGTMREMEIWREGDAERERWRAEQITEAERRQKQRAARPERGTGPELV